MAKKKRPEEVLEVHAEALVVPEPPKKKELILEGDPQQQLDFAHRAAKTLMTWVQQKPKKVIIRNEQYLEFGDWQILGRFYGATVSIEWTRPIDRNGRVWGYEARAVVLRGSEIISSAEGMCTRDEKRWATADEYAVRSMAQTRTSAKALRNAFGWVAELAGMKSTPAEEMDGIYDKSPVEEDSVPVVTYDDHEATNTIPTDIPTNIPEQRKRIFALLKMRGVDVSDGKACKAYVADLTQLDLVESNYAEIIKQLNN